MVMRSDGVDDQEVRDLLRRVADDLAAGAAQTLSAESAAKPSSVYRRGVGIMLLNHKRKVFHGATGRHYGRRMADATGRNR